MEKRLGMSTGLIALVALLLHALGGTGDRAARSTANSAPLVGSATEVKLSGTHATPAKANGPWVATQQYFHTGASGSNFENCLSHLQPMAERMESRGCTRSDLLALYGINGSSTNDIRAVLATVPDPLHTRMSVETDRFLDALQQAAYRSHWELATQWLPWAQKALSGSAPKAGAESDNDLEKLPGLIVFRQHFTNSALESRLLLMFIVGETATAGINGFEFETARRSAAILATRDPRHLAIIGPNFSGSFQPLTRLLEESPQGQTFDIRAGSVKNSIYATTMVNALTKANVKFTFHGSTLPSQSFEADFGSIIDKWGYRRSQAAELLEDESGFSVQKTGQDVKDEKGKPLDKIISTYRYPRDIAQLRNAYSDVAFATDTKQDGATQPAVNTSLKDSQSGEDTFPIFSSTHSAVSQNAVLEQIVRELRRKEIRIVSLSATNVFDTIFLAKVLAEYCPNTRVVISGADLLFVEEASRGSLAGVMAISSFPMFGDARRWTDSAQHDLTTFADSDSIGVYNAALAALRDESLQANGQQAFESTSGSAAQEGALFSSWFLVLGRYGWLPVDLFSEKAVPLLQERTKADTYSNHLLASWFDTTFAPAPKASMAKEQQLPLVTEGWTALAMLIAALTIGFCARFYYLRLHNELPVWSSLCQADVQSAGAQVSKRIRCVPKIVFLRYALLLSCLSTLTFLSGVMFAPLVIARFLYGSPAADPRVEWMAATSFGIAIGTALYVFFSVPIRLEKAGDAKGVLSPRAIGLRLAVLIVPLAGLLCWCMSCVSGSVSGWLFCFRALTLAPPTSPTLPVVLSGLAFFALAFLHLRRFTWAQRQQPLLEVSMLDDDFNGHLGDARDRITDLLFGPADFTRLQSVPVVPFAVIGAAVFSLIIFAGDSLRSFEPLWFSFLLTLLLLPISILTALSLFQFALCWSAIRGILVTLNSLFVGRHMTRLSDFSGSGPVWIHEIKLMAPASYMNSAAALHNLRFHWDGANAFYDEYRQKLTILFGPLSVSRNRNKWIDDHRAFRKTAAQITDELSRRVVRPFWQDSEIPFVDSESAEAPKPVKTNAAQENNGPELTFAARSFVVGAGASSGGSVLSAPKQPAEPQKEEKIKEEAYTMASKFVAFQYAAYVGYVLRHLQNLLLCSITCFVLLVLALNSFNFQAPQTISQFLIVGLVIGGAIVIRVLAQMERDPILSRMSGTGEGELGKDFYRRALMYGAAPVLTVVGTQFPAIAHFLSTWAEPTLAAMH